MEAGLVRMPRHLVVSRQRAFDIAERVVCVADALENPRLEERLVVAAHLGQHRPGVLEPIDRLEIRVSTRRVVGRHQQVVTSPLVLPSFFEM